MKLLEQIGSELQSRYTFSDINTFFAVVGISTDKVDPGGSNSKRIYAKSVLAGASEYGLLRVARELDLAPAETRSPNSNPPAAWTDTKAFRLFISHVSKDKLIALRLKDALASYEIQGFVAHEDIRPTLPWHDEIERALQTMDAFIAVLTEGFSASYWTQQEVGFALGKGVKIISFKMGEDPTGFIAREQALPRRNRTAEEIAAEIDALLASDPRTARRLDEAKDDAIPF